MKIDLKAESMEWISDGNIFEDMGYTLVDGIRETEGKTILHSYPTSDTRDEDGNLRGYTDALLFELIICDVKNKIYSKIEDRDGITFDGNAKHIKSRFFKDGSFMHIIGKGCKIGYYQDMEIILKD